MVVDSYSDERRVVGRRFEELAGIRIVVNMLANRDPKSQL
jgi:hypothetical protein